MSKLITRGFGGTVGSIITRGFIDAFVSPDIVSIDFVLKNRTINILCTKNIISFGINNSSVIFLDKINSVVFSLSERSMVFSLIKRVIEYILIEE